MDIISLNKARKAEELAKELEKYFEGLSLGLVEVERVLGEIGSKSHEHLNSEILGQLRLNDVGKIAYGIEELITDVSIADYTHSHPNKDVLGKLTEDSLGNLLYNGKEIATGSSSGSDNFLKINVKGW